MKNCGGGICFCTLQESMPLVHVGLFEALLLPCLPGHPGTKLGNILKL